VGQAVWAELVKNGDRIRNPALLPGWLVTTTRWKALQARQRRGHVDRIELHGTEGDRRLSRRC